MVAQAPDRQPAPQRPAVRPTLAITVGEPAGIGPEIAIRAAWALREQANCVLVGDAAFLALTASLIDPAIRLSALSTQALRNGGLLPADGDDRAQLALPRTALATIRTTAAAMPEHNSRRRRW